MPDEEKPIPIHGYIFGKLTREERDELMRRALEDQDVFNELWDSAGERELLQDPAYRARLLRSLEQPLERKGLAAVWEWLAGRWPRLAMAGAACLLLAFGVFLLTRGGGEGDQMLTLVTTPKTDLSTFFRLPLRNTSPVELDLHQTPPVFRPGDLVRATLRLTAPGAAFVLQRTPSGISRIVVPAALATSADLPSGETALVFDPVPPTTDVPARQTFTLRVIVLPPGRDLRTQSIGWAGLRGAYTARELTYDVIP